SLDRSAHLGQNASALTCDFEGLFDQLAVHTTSPKNWKRMRPRPCSRSESGDCGRAESLARWTELGLFWLTLRRLPLPDQDRRCFRLEGVKLAVLRRNSSRSAPARPQWPVEAACIGGCFQHHAQSSVME